MQDGRLVAHGRILASAGDAASGQAVRTGSSSIWAAGGAALGRVVDDERTRRAVSLGLAALLVASVALLWL